MDVVELRFTGLNGILDVGKLSPLVTGWLANAPFIINFFVRILSAVFAHIAYLCRKTLVIFVCADFVFRSSVNLLTFSILKIIVPLSGSGSLFLLDR